MSPADNATRNACSPVVRSGFFIHDSTKGYSHGCIEVDTAFFTRLRQFAERVARSGADATMWVTVRYRAKDMATHGWTDQLDMQGPLP